jgi:NADPH:quinone reductase-like Zn-dependent oxidoreductase
VVDVREPGAEQVVIPVDAAPINPTDILLLLGPADAATLVTSGPAETGSYGRRVQPGADAESHLPSGWHRTSA